MRNLLSTLILIGMLLTAFMGAGCARSSRQGRGDVAIELAAPLFAPAVGKSTLAFRLLDATGQPIDDAMLSIKGDMTHAGMTPVLADAVAGAGGMYISTFEWTMAGDWIVTVDATLADGGRASADFEFVVSGDAATCNDGVASP